MKCTVTYERYFEIAKEKIKKHVKVHYMPYGEGEIMKYPCFGAVAHLICLFERKGVYEYLKKETYFVEYEMPTEEYGVGYVHLPCEEEFLKFVLFELEEYAGHECGEAHCHRIYHTIELHTLLEELAYAMYHA